MTPPALDRLVRTCLAKDPDDRWQSAGDVARELKWIAEGSAAGAPRSVRRVAGGKRRAGSPWAIAAVAAVVPRRWPALLSRRPQVPEELDPLHDHAAPRPGLLRDRRRSLRTARRILFWLQDDGGRTSIAMRSLDSLEIAAAAGHRGRARRVLVARRPRDRFLLGREAQAHGRGGRSRPDDLRERERLFRRVGPRGHDPLHEGVRHSDRRRARRGRHASPGHRDRHGAAARSRTSIPRFLPDGRHFVFVARNLDPEKTAICSPRSTRRTSARSSTADSSAIFADPGYLLFARDNALFAWRFDPRSLELVGRARSRRSSRSGTGREDNLLAVSAAGNRLAYLPWLARRRLVWVDRKGRELGTLGEIGGYTDVRISPDGQKVAVTLRDPAHGQNQDVWVLDASRGTATRITAERTDEFDPAWFPDGERLVYVSDRVGFYDLYERPASGGDEKILVATKQDKVLPTVSPDGRALLYRRREGANFARVLAPAFRRRAMPFG